MKQLKVNTQDLAWQENDNAGFRFARKQLGHPAGGEMIGTSLFRLAAGDKAFPMHCHYANEEAIFVLSGQGMLRVGKDSDNEEPIDIVANDYIALPRGPDYAHQVINSSEDELVFLCISTMVEPEVIAYPDSQKIGMMVGSAPGGAKNAYSDKRFYYKNTQVGYYDGEGDCD